MKKGITPIIAIIILLLITIALAGAAWAYLQGFLIGQISKSFITPTGGAYCENGIIRVYVLNTGYESVLRTNDFIISEVDGISLPMDLNSSLNLGEGQAGLAFISDCDSGTGLNPPAACTSEYHTVRLGTQSTILNPRVSCT